MFKYKPEWQGPLSGPSFEKQTEDFLNGIESRVDEIDTRQTPSDATPMPPGVGNAGTSGEYSRGDHSHPMQSTVSGNAGTATKLETPRTIILTGDASGSGGFDGSADCSIPVSIQDATESSSGFMSAADKKTLDLLEDGTAVLYFNPQSSTLSSDQANLIAGECNVIKTGGKIVMIDVGGTNRTASIKQYLEGIGVSKVDYLVITHYHPDHCGNIANGNLLALDWSDCVVYLPSVGSSLSSEYTAAQNVKANCISFANAYCESIVYPSEGDTLAIDKALFTFLNCGATADAEIEAIQQAAQTAGISTQTYPLNDYSIVTKLEVGDAKALYTGDIQYAAEKRLCDNGLVGPVDLLKFPHHGDNSRRNLAYYIPFSDTVRARYVVVQEGSQNDQDRLRLEELNWGTDSVILFPKLLPTVFTAYNSCIALASTDHVAKKVEHIVCDSGVNIIGEGSDLNDFVEVGTYTIMSGEEARTMLHTPYSDGAGAIGNSKLIVLHGSTDQFVTQVLISGQDVFTRYGTLSGSIWSFGTWARMVKSIGNEIINGTKTFTSEIDISQTHGTFLRVKNSNIDRTTPPSSGSINIYLPIQDKNGKNLSAYQTLVYSSGEIRCEYFVWKDTAADASARMGVAYPASGNPYGYCPSTPTTGSGTDIVTRDYLEARLAQL